MNFKNIMRNLRRDHALYDSIFMKCPEWHTHRGRKRGSERSSLALVALVGLGLSGSDCWWMQGSFLKLDSGPGFVIMETTRSLLYLVIPLSLDCKYSNKSILSLLDSKVMWYTKPYQIINSNWFNFMIYELYLNNLSEITENTMFKQ